MGERKISGKVIVGLLYDMALEYKAFYLGNKIEMLKVSGWSHMKLPIFNYF